MDLLTRFLNVLPSMKNVTEREKLSQDHTEFQVRKKYTAQENRGKNSPPIESRVENCDHKYLFTGIVLFTV